MRIHTCGLGKLGLPVTLALEDAGHTVCGWDVSEKRRRDILRREVPESASEPSLGDLLARSRLSLAPLWSEQPEPDVVFIAVQTPHRPEFEGCVPLDREPEDFNYTALKDAVRQTADTIRKRDWDPLIVVVSTCLPGTFDRELRPIIECGSEYEPELRFAYHPLFIAMGSVIEDFRDPEFVLVGTDDGSPPDELARMYASVFWSPVMKRFRVMSVTSAELTKVAYNAWLGYKLMLANGIAELSDKVGANCDDVMNTLKLATDRLVSTQYMTPGMGDGGGCHPRDQIALSWLAGEMSLSHDPFGLVIRAREAHAEWLADLWWVEAQESGLPPLMLGGAYKPNTHLRTGSHALLVAHYIADRYPIRVEDGPLDQWPVACYFLATPHDHFLEAPVPAGSVMVDPWGLFPEREGVRIVRPGRRANLHQRPGSSDPLAGARGMA